MMRNWPVLSVTALRTFSISASLAASTVTPGRTAPEASRTTPLMVACALASAGASSRAKPKPTQRTTGVNVRMGPPGVIRRAPSRAAVLYAHGRGGSNAI
jgi:hypothetical protein